MTIPCLVVALLFMLAPSAANAYVYWATGAGADTIARANLDGTGASQSFITGADDPFAVAVDGLDPGPDTDPPETTVDSGSSSPTNDATPTFAFSSN